MTPQVTKHRKAKSSKHPKGLTLERFAAAKSSGYNKRDKKEKQFALDARKVNKYRKLKQKLQQQGLLPEVSQVSGSLFLCHKGAVVSHCLIQPWQLMSAKRIVVAPGKTARGSPA